MGDHYFSASPSSTHDRRQRTVHLAGRDVTVETDRGVFSPEHLDTGTRVLLDHVPDPAPGHLLDLGCGWGPIALAAALRAQSAQIPVRVWAVDVNERAVDLTASNAQSLNLADIHAALPDAVPADTLFTTIWSNPPIRIGKAALHALLQEWLPRLTPGGCAYLVVAKKLGADSLLRWLETELGDDFSAQRVDNAKGFRVLRVDRSSS